MNTFIYIAQSIDGYIADKNGNLDWLNEIPNPDKDDFGFAIFMSNIDAIVMGRKTFEKVQSFSVWPYTKMVYVISSSLNKLPSEYSKRAQILRLTPSQIIEKLNKEGFENLYIDGGALIQSFLSEDLINELIITSIPVILGDGVPLFNKLNNQLKFKHVSTEVLIGSLVKSHYIRQK